MAVVDILDSHDPAISGRTASQYSVQQGVHKTVSTDAMAN